MGQAWRTRPSELYCIEDPYEAFRFDRAVFLFGTALTAELDKQEGKNSKEIQKARDRVFAKWIPTEASKGPQQFRDPSKRQV